MKFFAILFVLSGILEFALTVGTGTGTVGTGTGGFGSGTGTYGSASTTEVATNAAPAISPCGPQGPCGLLKCLGGAGGCGQKVYIFNK